MTTQKSNTGIIIAGIVIGLCCIGAIVLSFGGYVLYSFGNAIPTSVINPTHAVTDLPFDIPTLTSEPDTARPQATEYSTSIIALLENTIVPSNEPGELACRLEGRCDIPGTLAPPVAPRVVGNTDVFWVFNWDTHIPFEVQATLQYVTPHVYFWVEDGVMYDSNELKSLADTFESKIYPTDREFFGSEWSPGIDGDDHIYILYAGGIGSSIAGYFSSLDEIHPMAHEFSNAHEMFLFNSDLVSLGNELTYGVLAHELQHMIHWYQDKNETTWINEGFSDLAMMLNGYPVGNTDQAFILNPDIQLNDWPNDHNATFPHYGAAFLYLAYFLDRFGEDATKALIKDPANGFDSVDNALIEINAVDALTQKPIVADEFFMDWAVTNFLLDSSVGDGRYVYHNYAAAPQASPTEMIMSCPQSPLSRDVHQYGADYILIECAGDYTLSFTGSTAAKLLPVDPYSGQYALWSNKGDESDMTLTREFDFTNATAPITFSFQAWYDVEKDYDYVYLEVSDDGGKTWQIVTTPFGTAEDPSGNSYGWAYNGTTNDWIKEDVDFSAYAGKKVSIRFEYVTDAAVNGSGFMLDDVSIDAINYTSDFETDDGGWVAEGFVRVENSLPQTFRLALIIKRDQTTVEMIPLNENQTAEIKLTLKAGEQAILVVSGVTRFTLEHATYQIEIK